MSLTTGSHDDKGGSGQLVISKIANDRSQIELDVKTGAWLEIVPPKTFQTMKTFCLLKKKSMAEFHHSKC